MRGDGEWWFAIGSSELNDFEPEAFDGPFSSREEAIREAREDITRELEQDGSELSVFRKGAARA